MARSVKCINILRSGWALRILRRGPSHDGPPEYSESPVAKKSKNSAVVPSPSDLTRLISVLTRVGALVGGRVDIGVMVMSLSEGATRFTVAKDSCFDIEFPCSRSITSFSAGDIFVIGF